MIKYIPLTHPSSHLGNSTISCEDKGGLLYFSKNNFIICLLMIIIFLLFLFFNLFTPLTFQTCYWVCFNKLSGEWWSRTISRARLRYPILQLTIFLYDFIITLFNYLSSVIEQWVVESNHLPCAPTLSDFTTHYFLCNYIISFLIYLSSVILNYL